MFNIGIIRESRSDDRRAPLVPKNVKELLNTYTDLSIIVQPSSYRCYSDQEYQKEGAFLSEDLNECDLILGVKEIEASALIESKNYMFFSHTSKIQPDNSAAAQGTPGMDKKELLLKNDFHPGVQAAPSDKNMIEYFFKILSEHSIQINYQ